MSYYYDPYGRRRAALMRQQQATRNEQQRPPTQEDYAALRKAYDELRTAYEELRGASERQGKELAKAEQELQIKNEALHQQGADVKNLEAELMWAKAAVQQQEGAASAQHDAEKQEDWADRYARLQAEVDNLRKRWEQRFATETAEARHRILLDMLPLADHLEMAMKHLTEQEGAGAASVIGNMEAVQRAFLDTLRRYGVTPIDALGRPFDPNLHEAVGQIHTDTTPPGAVAAVVQTGYQEGERLLRPARVLVNQGGG